MEFFLKNALVFLRRLLGTQQSLRLLEAHIRREKDARPNEHALLLGNAWQYAQLDLNVLKTLPAYTRSQEIISFLSPMDIDGVSFWRVGGANDGGYVMPAFKAEKIEAAYSFGINDDVSWDEAVAGSGIDVFMYDHTIKTLPKDHPRFHFFTTGVTGFDQKHACETLSALILRNHHQEKDQLLLKIDIEGGEWDVFAETSSKVLEQFAQIVVEFHGLRRVYDVGYQKMVSVLEKVHKTHQSVHVHANNATVPLWIGGLTLPDNLEVTYVRRRDFDGRLRPGTRYFPTEIDAPNDKTMPDIFLGRFVPARKD